MIKAKKYNYIIDLDGTLYHGSSPIPYAKEFIEYLNQQKRFFLLATNCPRNTSSSLLETLAKMGIQAGEDNIFTSGQATASFLARTSPGAKVYLVGGKALETELLKEGLQLVEDDPDYVVVGYDPDFTYEKMKKAVQRILKGAVFITTNEDTTIPTEEGIVPHTGAISSSIETATGIKPLVIGKPEKYFVDEALRRMGCEKEDCCIIGDRLETDILTGVKHDITSYLVFTGVTNEAMLEHSTIQPTKSFKDLGELVKFDKESL